MFAILLFFFVSESIATASERDVDKLVNEINSFMNDTNYWIEPTDNGNYFENIQNCDESTFEGLYDFIIVGAGISGSVLANRLAENKEWTILLLEAGGWENEITDIPGLVNDLRLSDFNWGYQAAPQKVQGGFINNSITTPRGKALGGCSVINAMIYARGNPKDYNNWASLGNPGWEYKSVLPYFKKSENVRFPNANPKYHGKNGTLNVEYTHVFSNLSQAFLDANEMLGRKLGDYNADTQMRFSKTQFTTINGRRDSAAFLDSVRDKSNVKILTNAYATKIRFSKYKKGRGVEYVRNGNKYHAFTKKEIIISAGSLNTPQLLMLSGIGPRDELKKHNISIIADLPVGKGLKDHLMLDVLQFSTNYTFEKYSLRQDVEQYLKGEGSLTNPGNAQAIGYVNLMGLTDPNVPDIEHVFHLSSGVSSNYSYYRRLLRYTQDTYENIVKPADNIPTWSVHSVLLHPKSTGKVYLKSNSPKDFPIIDPQYLSEQQDVDTFVAAIKDFIKISETEPMRRYNSSLIPVKLPQCKSLKYGSDQFWECMVRNLATTLHHFTSTAKMGSKCDPTTVVDNKLKIHGVRNLRVVDCSVIPVTLSGHPSAAAYMLAEKAADLIKAEY